MPIGSFYDQNVPPGLAPFNIWNIGGKLYVAYARQDAAKKFDVAGVGNGYVSVFDSNGKLLQSLVAGGGGSLLNSPWGACHRARDIWQVRQQSTSEMAW